MWFPVQLGGVETPPPRACYTWWRKLVATPSRRDQTNTEDHGRVGAAAGGSEHCAAGYAWGGDGSVTAGQVGMAAGAAVSRPAPSRFILKQIETEDIEAYLPTFERTAVREK